MSDKLETAEQIFAEGERIKKKHSDAVRKVFADMDADLSHYAERIIASGLPGELGVAMVSSFTQSFRKVLSQAMDRVQ